MDLGRSEHPSTSAKRAKVVNVIKVRFDRVELAKQAGITWVEQIRFLARRAIENLRRHVRTCPFHGCTKNVRDGMFCCTMHWFNDLTSRDRSALSSANKGYGAQMISADELRRHLRSQVSWAITSPLATFCPIPGISDGSDHAGVALELTQLLARRHVPNAKLFVKAGASSDLSPTLTNESSQRRAARQAPVAIAQRQVDGRPRLASRCDDGTGILVRPRTRPSQVLLRPSQYLRDRQAGQTGAVAHATLDCQQPR